MRIAVVGDVLLDVDIEGRSERRSPDSGVPVVDILDRRIRPGGAGLAAALLERDGHDVALVTAVADDRDAAELVDTMDGIRLVAGVSPGPTAVKTRVIESGRHVMRIDSGCQPTPPPLVTAGMIAAISAADAILVSDYGRGIVRDVRVRRAIHARCGRAAIVWDPHPRGPEPVAGVTAVTPNLAEAHAFGGDADIARLAAGLRERWRSAAVVVTLGAEGACVAEDESAWRDPVRDPVVGDPCGAGDRFASALVVGLAAGASLGDAVREAGASTRRFLREGGAGALSRSVPAPLPAEPDWPPRLDRRELDRRQTAGPPPELARGGRR